MCFHETGSLRKLGGFLGILSYPDRSERRSIISFYKKVFLEIQRVASSIQENRATFLSITLQFSLVYEDTHTPVTIKRFQAFSFSKVQNYCLVVRCICCGLYLLPFQMIKRMQRARPLKAFNRWPPNQYSNNCEIRSKSRLLFPSCVLLQNAVAVK